MAKLTKLEKACGASGLTVKEACEVIGVSAPTFIGYKKNALQMTFNQFFELAKHMDDDGRMLLTGVLDEARALAGRWKPLGELTLGEYYGAKESMGVLDDELEQCMKSVFGQD